MQIQSIINITLIIITLIIIKSNNNNNNNRDVNGTTLRRIRGRRRRGNFVEWFLKPYKLKVKEDKLKKRIFIYCFISLKRKKQKF